MSEMMSKERFFEQFSGFGRMPGLIRVFVE
jgi:hypothetical protein